jgi:uncharacterized circularly permuted ATP-grasp superfamily protein
MIQGIDASFILRDTGMDVPNRVFLGRRGADLPYFRAAAQIVDQSESPVGGSGAPVESESGVQWDQLGEGIKQRFEAMQIFMELLLKGRKLPESLRIPVDSVLFRRMRHLAGGLSGHCRGPVGEAAWTWFGATDFALRPDGELCVVDQDFSLPSGLERLSEVSGYSAGKFVQFVRRELFPDGVHCGGEPALMLEPAHAGSAGAANGFLAECLQVERVHRGLLRVERGGLRVLREGRWDTVRFLVRRIDDDLLDPNFFRPDSLVGVPGLVRHWCAGSLTVFSAPGSGLFRQRAIVSRVPQMIREFLGESPRLRTVEQLEFDRESDLAAVERQPQQYMFRPNDPLEAVRPCCGRTASADELNRILERIRSASGDWCARPLRPNLVAGLHFRVFASMTDRFRILPLGLARRCDLDGGAPALIPAECPISLLF